MNGSNHTTEYQEHWNFSLCFLTNSLQKIYLILMMTLRCRWWSSSLLGCEEGRVFTLQHSTYCWCAVKGWVKLITKWIAVIVFHQKLEYEFLKGLW